MRDSCVFVDTTLCGRVTDTEYWVVYPYGVGSTLCTGQDAVPPQVAETASRVSHYLGPGSND